MMMMMISCNQIHHPATSLWERPYILQWGQKSTLTNTRWYCKTKWHSITQHLSELRPVIRPNVCLFAENQLVMLSYNVQKLNFTPHQTIHLHGHGFAVMSMGFGLPNATGLNYNPDIVCHSTICAAASWNKSRDVYVIMLKNFQVYKIM